MTKKLIALASIAVLAIVVSACTTSLYSNTNTKASNSAAATNANATNTAANTNQSVNQASSSAAVSIQNFAFSPFTLTVTKGATVTWTNNDSASHTITSTIFDSGTVAPGSTYSQTFNTTGTIDYHCSIHPSMNGRIIVQ